MKARVRAVSRDNIPERFTTEYLKERSFRDKSGCVLWEKSINQAGYAQVGVWPYNAHVLSYVLNIGPLEVHEIVRHICHNKACINPDHLEKGSHKDNWRDSEEVHRESSRLRRGVPALNRIPIQVDGEIFGSKSEAMRVLKRGHKYIDKNGKPLNQVV